jgi:excisionase family DNA binding protein
MIDKQNNSFMQGVTSDIRINPPLQMSVKEAAVFLHLSERKLREYIGRKQIKVARFGTKIIVRKSDADSFVESLVR